MNVINIESQRSTVVFAAEELKKYLRMLMPRAGEFRLSFGGESRGRENEGGIFFRLGLMEDMGISAAYPFDKKLDDVIFIDADENGGTIAGSNEGAVVIAVYRYLKKCGCRWLFPGIDGELVPFTDKLPEVKTEKKASYRYRGQCNEGAESQRCMMETIDYNQKIGLNSYMLEFDIPTAYYDWYYKHLGNSCREPEPVSADTILRWKRQCEAEISKRGLKFHDMGHGWTAEPFGLSSLGIWEREDQEIPEKVRPFLAELEGVRDIYKGVALNTNICMSTPEARAIMANYIADYAEKQNNVDFLHIWLADASNNHCECEKCKKKTPTDWYVMLLNDIDAEFTKRNLSSHLVFISYYDTMWAPKTERIKNESRFTMLFAPISRTYSETYGVDADVSKITDYKLNDNILPKGMAEGLGYLKKWQEVWHGDSFVYEYHFWQQQFLDLSGLYHARLLYEDVRALKKHGLGGIIEDGSQRSFFPTGFSYYVYGETLFDSEQDFEELKKDYFTNAFGEDWSLALDYLEKVKSLIDFEYVTGNRGTVNEKGEYHRFINPEYVEKAREMKKEAEAFEKIAKAHRYGVHRTQNVSWNILAHHCRFVSLMCDVIEAAASGAKEKANEKFKIWKDEFSEREVYIEANYDHFSAERVLNRFTN